MNDIVEFEVDENYSLDAVIAVIKEQYRRKKGKVKVAVEVE